MALATLAGSQVVRLVLGRELQLRALTCLRAELGPNNNIALSDGPCMAHELALGKVTMVLSLTWGSAILLHLYL